MLNAHVVWDLADEPDGNIEHIAEHGLTQEEVEEVLLDPDSETALSRSSSNRITFGFTTEGRYIAVVWEHVMDDPLTLRPITAYEIDEPGRKQR